MTRELNLDEILCPHCPHPLADHSVTYHCSNTPADPQAAMPLTGGGAAARAAHVSIGRCGICPCGPRPGPSLDALLEGLGRWLVDPYVEQAWIEAESRGAGEATFSGLLRLASAKSQARREILEVLPASVRAWL